MLASKMKYSAGISLAVASLFALSACTASDSESSTSEAMNTMAPSPAMSQEPTPSETASMDAYANLVGAGCSAYDTAVPDGAGSVQGMSQDPVAVAASNNPMLSTLTAAVSGGLNPSVNLVDTLNGNSMVICGGVQTANATVYLVDTVLLPPTQ